MLSRLAAALSVARKLAKCMECSLTYDCACALCEESRVVCEQERSPPIWCPDCRSLGCRCDEDYERWKDGYYE